MIDVKDAVKAANEAFKELVNEDYSGPDLEEVEMSDDDQYWYVTLGYFRPTPKAATAGVAGSLVGLLPPGIRKYKIFKIRADDGKVLSMKIRQP